MQDLSEQNNVTKNSRIYRSVYPICQAPLCPNETVARIKSKESEKRFDLCFAHAAATMKYYSELSQILMTWNNTTTEDIEVGE